MSKGTTYRRLVTGLLFALTLLLAPIGMMSAAAQDTTPTPVTVTIRHREVGGAAQGIPVTADTADDLGLTVKHADTGDLVVLPKGSAAVIRLVDFEGSSDQNDPRGPVVSILYFTATPEDLLVGAGYDGVATHHLDAWTSKDLVTPWPSLETDACNEVNGALNGSVGEKAGVVEIMIPGTYASMADVLFTLDYSPICKGLPVVGA